ncbi:MAG: DMT family transporter [Micrococcales bacterium]|nr:DMT family transporter [Micrococcales bacterium]
MTTPDLQSATEFLQQPAIVIGILIALIGAVFLSLGAQFQHRGVTKVEARHGNGTSGLSGKQLLLLFGRPSWVMGTIMLGLAIVLQLTALGFAPLIVVQPIGIVALIITTVLNARVSRVHLSRATVRSVVLCVAGVATFVVTAAIVAVEPRLQVGQLLAVVIILFAVLGVLIAVFVIFRRRLTAIFYISGAGILYGFVATSAKVVINRVIAGSVDLLSLLAVVALLGAMGLGMYFVQTAYSIGAPDLVIAGLTVVDPMVAVVLAIVVLGEANQAASRAPWAIPVWIVAGIVAVFGVVQLARHPSETPRSVVDAAPRRVQ